MYVVVGFKVKHAIMSGYDPRLLTGAEESLDDVLVQVNESMESLGTFPDLESAQRAAAEASATGEFFGGMFIARVA